MVEKPDSEHRQIAKIAERLALCHPEIPVADVECLVESIYARFDDAHVRDFIPLLVERRAREQLGQRVNEPGKRVVSALPTAFDFPVTERLEQADEASPMGWSA
ncbi:DUF3562 domain-containing protein [Williamsia muralis]|uniref:three-helix bundle dimerization domain-containing protein n=1 Tax=Williamsia marianensis TaxID=85044 RepID=UPI003F149ACB